MDEYISREAAIGKMKSLRSNFKAKNDWDSGYDTAIAEAFEHIKRVPIADVEPVDRWIDAQKNPPPVVDKKSMSSESVLILRGNGRYAVAYYCYDAEDGNYWTTDDDKTMYAWEEVTHWQPLPGLPKDDDIEKHIEVGRPDGNCLDCKFQYLENSDYWCSVCPGNPEDI